MAEEEESLSYYKSNIFDNCKDIKEDHMQLSKFTSNNLDIISIYRSYPGNYEALNQNIEDLIDREKPQLVVGDFNYCYLKSSPNTTKQYFSENNFEQLIRKPTHIEGNLLDQAHLRDIDRIL